MTLLAHVLATTPTSTPTKKGNSFLPFLILLVLFMVAYFIFIRPARNRQQAQLAVRRSAEVGDEVTTTAGLIATVVAIDDDYLTLEVAPGVHCKYVPAAILRVNGDDEEPEPEDDEDEAGGAHDVTNHEVIEAPETPDPTVTPNETTDGTTDTPGGSPQT